MNKYSALHRARYRAFRKIRNNPERRRALIFRRLSDFFPSTTTGDAVVNPVNRENATFFTKVQENFRRHRSFIDALNRRPAVEIGVASSLTNLETRDGLTRGNPCVSFSIENENLREVIDTPCYPFYGLLQFGRRSNLTNQI